MSNLFQKLELEAFRAGITPRTAESREWFRKRIQRLTRINREQLMREDELEQVRTHSYGGMFMFFYDPKTKDKLPYYDTFPLTIPVEPAKGGFYGVNLHYLPPILRAKFLDGLLEITNNKKYDNTTKFRLTYSLLSGTRKFRYFKPCFKHYLLSHVKSKFAEVPAPEWEIATFLPTASWKKSSAGSIYSDSRRAANGN
ncbi:MAG: hypothetical protein CMK23_01535 [Porticoccaceae bacterium]|jgi:hypothetical protein|nr:hypothetical protein [Porticoccaceae bacterium]|tara:strand:- start:397 stop:990 length:594 start_codon:yes stop_codon:yes gene_type:complete